MRSDLISSARLAQAWRLGLAVIAGIHSSLALAQQVPSLVLEEIVVTAQKRSENVQDVPSSITVLGGETLEEFGATNLTEYAAYVPGMSVDTIGNPGEARITLRGIAPIGSGTAVGSYLDDVPVGSSTQHSGGSQLALDLMPYDLERIEVLRGPQGTLYGASTMGGLMKYVTVSPSTEQFEARVGAEALVVSGGEDTGWAGRASVNIPFADNALGLRASLYHQRTPGYIDNLTSGKGDTNEVVQKGGRLALAWHPSEALRVKLAALIQDVDTDDTAAVWRGVDLQESEGDLVSRYTQLQPFHQRLEIYSATIDWDLGWASLTSASSYQESENNIFFDETFAWTPYFQFLDPSVSGGISGLDEDILLKKHTQELRLASPSGGRIEWLAGAFYTRERATITQDADALTPGGTPIATLNPFLFVLQHDSYDEYAAFGDLTYRFTDNFDVTAGIRWSHNSQDFDEIIDGAFGFLILPAPPPQTSTGESSEDVTTYMISPRFHINEDSMVYARVATGYRPGGPNVGVAGVPPQVDADTLVNYELGLKTRFLDRRGSLDLAAFYIDWTDIQITVIDPATSIGYNSNAGSARSRGVEFTTSYSPIDGLVLGLNAAYTDAVLTSELPPNAPPLGWRNGDRLPYAPRWNGSVTADYEFPVFGAWLGKLGAGYRYVGDRYSAPPGYPLAVRSPAYRVLDLNAALSNERWTLRIYGKNLTDTRAYLSPTLATDPLSGALDHIETTILQPRTVGVSVDVRF